MLRIDPLMLYGANAMLIHLCRNFNVGKREAFLISAILNNILCEPWLCTRSANIAVYILSFKLFYKDRVTPILQSLEKNNKSDILNI